MSFLTVCQYGHSRSVALARVLHGRGYPAIACGVGTCGTAIDPLSAWADKILVLEDKFANYVPAQFRSKVVSFDVGPDRWSNPYSQELLAILGRMVEERLPEIGDANGSS